VFCLQKMPLSISTADRLSAITINNIGLKRH
jgi:hypothetical protein